MGDDSTPRNILELSYGYNHMYKIMLDNDDIYKFTENEIESFKQYLTDNITTSKKGRYLAVDTQFINKLKHLIKITNLKIN